MVNRFIYSFLFIFYGSVSMNGQFEIPDTVCVGEVLEMEYFGSSNNFCVSPSTDIFFFNFDAEPVQNFENGNIPVFSDIVKDGENYYIFTTISINGNLVRLDFGNSLNNTPTSTTFTLDSLPPGQEGLQILNDNGHWWGFIVGGNIDFFGPEYLVRLDFGNSITNEPSVENLGNIGNLYFPHDLFITKENENWIGFTINKLGSSLTRFNFGNTLANTPTAINLGNVGNIFRPTGFFPIEVNGAWHFFVTNAINSTFSRIDFGSSLLNSPTGINMGNLGLLNRPRDVLIIESCDSYFGLVLNRIESEIILLNFANDIQNQPVATSFDDLGNFSYPHSITETHITESGITLFINYVETGELLQVTFEFPLGFYFECKNSIDEFEIAYPSAGNYTLQIITDEGLPSQTIFCKDIVVTPLPLLNLGQDTSACLDKSLTLESNFLNTLWENQSIGKTFEVNESGFYIGETTVGKCTVTDSVEVVFEDCEFCYSFPNVFTPNGDLINDEFKPLIKCDHQITEYKLVIYNRWGQKVFETNNPLDGWDGKINGKHSTTDVYVWKSSFSYTKSGNIFEKTAHGDLTLIR